MENTILEACELLGKKLEYIKDPKHLILHLLRVGIIKTKTLDDFMILIEYDKQLERTKSRHNRRGNKQMAIHFVCGKFDVSERKVFEIVKKRSLKFNNSLFLRK